MRALALLLIVTLAAPSICQERPSSIDPTFGKPIPRVGLKAKKLPPDAKWIWAAQTRDHQEVVASKSFRLTRKGRAASLYVTADDFFRALVNGTEVGSTQLDPNDVFVWSHVHRFDVTALLKPGINRVEIRARNEGGLAGILARLTVDDKVVALTDQSWIVVDVARRLSGVGTDPAHVVGPIGMEPWGNRLTGWPVPVTQQPSYLDTMPIQPVAMATLTGHKWQHLEWRPVSLDGVTGTILLDFGKELPGRVAVQNDSDSAATVGTGESEGEAIEKPWTSTDLQLSAGKPSFTPYTALRYVKVTPSKGELSHLKVWVEHLYYPVEYRGSFDCSDPLLTQMWYTGAYTAHSCMQQDIWDAPKRDRARWMGDLHVSGEVINNVFLDKFLMEQTLTRLREEAQGGKPDTAEPVNHVNGIPGYSCAWVAGLADFYRHTGDLAYLKSQHEALISMLDYFRGELDSDGVFANKRGKWPFVDWSPDFDKDGPLSRAATHLFLIKALREAVFLFTQLGDNTTAGKYGAWADELTRAAQVHLQQNGVFSDRRQENAMAIYSGVATPAQTDAIYHAVFTPDSVAWSKVATPYYNNYVLYAMSMAGHTEDALKFARSYWGGMIAQGATTFWEGYDPAWEKENFHAHLQADDGTGYFVSLCHGWSAGVTSWLTEDVLGIKSTGAGFQTCTISPDSGDLQWASGEVPTPHGNISAKVEHRGSDLLLHLVVPSGVKLSLSSPTNSLEVNGRPVAGASALLPNGRVEAVIHPSAKL